MLNSNDATEMLAHDLQQIKLLHTAIWGVMAGSILALPWLAWRGRFRWAFGLTLLVVVECVILALNGGGCPLTDVAARYTQDRACNFDIYLPVWLACYNKQIFGFLFVIGVTIVVWRWARRPGF